MKKEVQEFLTRCPTCQIHARSTGREPMSILPPASYPFQMVGIDMVGPLILSTKTHSRYIITCIDYYSGWTEAMPVQNKSTANVIEFYMNVIVARHGVPEILICDQGAEFQSTDFRRILQEMGTEMRRTTQYHPETNGKVERWHRTIKGILAKLMNNVQGAWENHLQEALLSYRISVSETTHFSPFFLLYGKQPRIPSSRMLPDQAATLPQRLQHMQQALRAARAATDASRARNKARIDRKAKTKHVEPGDHVTLKVNEPLPLTARRDPLWLVTRVRGPVVTLQHQRSGATKVVNKEKIRLADPNTAWQAVNPRPKRDRRPAAEKRREWLERCEPGPAPPPRATAPAACPAPAERDASPLTNEMETDGDGRTPQAPKRGPAVIADESAAPEPKRPRHRYHLRKRGRSHSPPDQAPRKRECLGSILFC